MQSRRPVPGQVKRQLACSADAASDVLSCHASRTARNCVQLYLASTCASHAGCPAMLHALLDTSIAPAKAPARANDALQLGAPLAGEMKSMQSIRPRC